MRAPAARRDGRCVLLPEVQRGARGRLPALPPTPALQARAARRGGRGKRTHQVSSGPLAAILTDPSGKRIRLFLVSLPREPASRHWPISVAERPARDQVV